MGSWNMPPGVSVTMIPGWEDPPYFPDIRCDVCGAWIGYTGQRVPERREEHVRTYHCKGGDFATCENYFDCKEEHDWTEYDGQTEWHKCKNCGTEVPVKFY